MSGWSADFKKGFFLGAGVITAAAVIGMLLKKA
jgi:hypothetical protein